MQVLATASEDGTVILWNLPQQNADGIYTLIKKNVLRNQFEYADVVAVSLLTGASSLRPHTLVA